MQSANALPSAPDFRHVNVWVFDLDNTLYPADSRLFAQIEARMTLFVQRYLCLDHDEARRVQKTYYRDHGTTLGGLMRLHGLDPEDYLAFVHDIDLMVLEADARLAEAISNLPGRRFVFTNGCRYHAGRVLARLAISHLFEDCWDIRTIAFCPKPDPASYRDVLAHADAAPSRTAVFDDIPRNLVPAHELGCTTVLVGNDELWSKQGPEQPDVRPEHVHYEARDLCGFLEDIRVAR
ncbi:MAG TPA: pyrimidine 5'-nucleotidase [Rhizomicrobium sp.]|jgi:putative hydrolase of the HAD superfamily|nr:pyrimidine 5'-nucleotidase [Rhizomicrobium sp.]